jgi:preprotein translocase subunit SecE
VGRPEVKDVIIIALMLGAFAAVLWLADLL